MGSDPAKEETMEKQTQLKIIQQRIWRGQLKVIHINWREENVYYEAKLKEVLYDLEDGLIALGILRRTEDLSFKKKKVAL